METPVKHLKVGDRVIVHGYEQYGERRIESLYSTIAGGVRLDAPVDLWRSWNEDELEILT